MTKSVSLVFIFALCVVFATGHTIPSQTENIDLKDEAPAAQTVQQTGVVQVPPQHPVTVEPNPHCLSGDGTFPNWQDDSCQSYIVCQNFISVVHKCPEGQAFSGLEGRCTTGHILGCHLRNGALKVADKALSFLRGSILKAKSFRVKRSSDPADVDALEESERIMVSVPSEVCRSVSGNMDFLESTMNELLMEKANCPDNSCGMPLLSFYCKTDDDDDDDDNDDDDDEEQEEDDDGGNGDDDEDDEDDGDDQHNDDDNKEDEDEKDDPSSNEHE